MRQPVLLPEAWSMYPAATDDLLLIRRYFGRSGKRGEHTQVVVAGPDGQVHRSMTLPFPFLDRHGYPDHVVGEVDAGVVTARGIVGWDGHELTGDAIEHDPEGDTATPVVLPRSRSGARPSARVGVTSRLCYPPGFQPA